jgi:antitoxin MazE
MEVSVIKIGNSKGIRLSKAVLERYQIKDKVEIQLEEDQIVLKHIDKDRDGWDDAFKRMNQEKDDTLLIEDVFEDENLDEWN